jgi:hypothetical protein
MIALTRRSSTRPDTELFRDVAAWTRVYAAHCFMHTHQMTLCDDDASWSGVLWWT